MPPAVTVSGSCMPAVQRRRGLACLVRKSRFDSPAIPECNFAQKVMEGWQSYDQKVAMVDVVTEQCVTYGQLYNSVMRTASGLRNMGFEAGDVICICSHNSLEYPVLTLAVIAIGGVVTTVNPLCTADELRRLLAVSKASYVYCTGHCFAVVQRAVDSKPNGVMIKIIVHDLPATPKGIVQLSAIMGNSGSNYDGIPTIVDSKNALAYLPFSSGTTGLPKGVMLTHYNLTANVMQREPFYPVKTTHTVAGVLPFFHIGGFMMSMAIGLHSGARLVVYPRWDPVMFLSGIERHRINLFTVVPPILIFMAKDSMTAQFDLSSMEHFICSAAPLGEPLSMEFTKKFPNVELRQGYGLTEGSPGALLNSRTHCKLGSVGELLPGVDAKIVNLTTGEDCGPNSEGEMLLRGPNITKGYFENPSANALSFVDGWLRTGDVAYYDTDGFFFVVDRVKELIKYKGSQVAPAELEAILLSHSSVRDAAVIGVPDEKAGELPRAYVCIKKGHHATPEALANYVAELVSPNKKLRGGVEIVEDIPRSATGKILRRMLKERAGVAA